MLYWTVLCVVLMSCCCHGAFEPPSSKILFDFEERLIEKLVNLDHTVKTSLKEMDTKIANLENEIATKLGEYETKLETRVEGIEKDRRNMITQQELQKLEIRANIEQYQANITDIEDAQSALKFSLDRLELRDSDTSVAFIAKSVSVIDPSAGDTIIFTTPVMNLGLGYNPSTGIFKAPVAGVYMFSVQLCIDDVSFINFEIRTRQIILSRTQHGALKIDDTCDAVTTVADLASGVEVWVKCLARDTQRYTIEPHKNPDLFWNMFTGVLVQQVYY